MANEQTWEAPVVCPERHVESAWIDYNGHMNMAYYAMAFDQALDSVFDRLGIGADYADSGQGTTFTLEAHIVYLQEVMEGDPLRISLQLLDHSPKCLHHFMTMHHARDGYLAATIEQMTLHVDLATRRSAPFPEAVQARAAALGAAHAGLPRPDHAGRVIGIRR